MVSGGFFTGSERRDDRIAGNLGPSTPIKNYGGNMGFSQDFGAGRVKNVRPKPGFGLKDVFGDGTPRAQFFNPRKQEGGQIASSGFTQVDDTSFLDRDDAYKKEMNSIYGEKGYQKLPGFIKKDIKLDYLDRNPIKYKKFLDSSFAPSGNEVGQIASATTDLSGLSDEDNYKAYMKVQGIRYPRTLSPMFHRLNKENFRDDVESGRFKDGQFINRAPEQNPLDMLLS